jgi:hypothetical protein
MFKKKSVSLKSNNEPSRIVINKHLSLRRKDYLSATDVCLHHPFVREAQCAPHFIPPGAEHA